MGALAAAMSQWLHPKIIIRSRFWVWIPFLYIASLHSGVCL